MWWLEPARGHRQAPWRHACGRRVELCIRGRARGQVPGAWTCRRLRLAGQDAPLEPVDLLDQRVLLALRRSREPTGALPCSTRKEVTTEAAACCIRGWKRGSHSAPCGRAARRTQRTQPWASYECVGGAPFLAAFSPSNSAFFSRRSWAILCVRSCASMRARHRQVWAHDSALTRSGDAGGPPRAGRAVAGRGAPPDRPYWHRHKWPQKAPPLVQRQNGVC